jgi:hypothetical protein
VRKVRVKAIHRVLTLALGAPPSKRAERAARRAWNRGQDWHPVLAALEVRMRREHEAAEAGAALDAARRRVAAVASAITLLAGMLPPVGARRAR